MDFTFSPEQEDLRREARSFLEANPSPSMAELRELGWVGMLQTDEFSFVDAAVLFEELGRALYEGPTSSTRWRVRAATRRGRSRSTASSRTSTGSTACSGPT